MRTLLRLAPFTVYGLICVQGAAAQTGVTLQSLSGVVRIVPALVTGRPLSVCVLLRPQPNRLESRCAVVDSAGAYRLDSLPSRNLRASVVCDGWRPPFNGLLASDSVDIPRGASMRHDWQVSPVRCDPRPLRRVTGDFQGHFVSGFETSQFKPCPNDAWFLPGDSLDSDPFDNRRASVTWSEKTDRSMRWPQGVKADSYGQLRYFVRWRGTVVGPGRYGHLGASPFELFVDSMMEMRVPSAMDCR